VLGTNPKIAIGLLSPVGLLFALPVLLWAFNFTERFGLEKCSIGSISGAEYQNILSRAGWGRPKKQDRAYRHVLFPVQQPRFG